MRKKKLLSEINITSLVDVSLTLLIIFILSAPLLKASIDVSLPRTEAAKFVEKEGLTVTLNKDEEIFIEKKKVDKESFEKEFKRIVSLKSPKMVYLNADKEVPYGFAIEILGRIKVAGIENVGLSAELE
jgi:biopolymer transport protein ExbD